MTGGGPVEPYVELGAPRDALSVEIRCAYRQAARRHHPDVKRDPGRPERFVAAARAYEILSDPAARARQSSCAIAVGSQRCASAFMKRLDSP